MAHMMHNPLHKNDEFQDTINAVPSNQGQQSVSGSESTPVSDDDTLQAAKDVGMQLHEDEQHPKEVDLGHDINKAEEYHKTR